ncbi:MAG: hypothetical protein UH249_10110 [Acutalibacteraceae bacterium]|nr:hypothetical protein [Acutalibacteraceae bacterium]
MSPRADLLYKLTDIANDPQNEFDKIIAANKRYLLLLSADDLSALCTLRRKSLRLCRKIPYSREDITSLVDNSEVSPYEMVAELEYSFRIADYIFSKVSGEE